MILVNRNTVIDKHIIVSVPYNTNYVLTLQDSRGNVTAYNLNIVNYSQRFAKLLFKKGIANSLRFGEYKYSIYHANSANDTSYEGKTRLEVGILKVI